jgi:hypothetical protein
MKIIHNTACCKDYCTVFPAVFYQQAETYTTNFEAHAVFVFLVQDDFSGWVSESGQNLIFFLIKTKHFINRSTKCLIGCSGHQELKPRPNSSSVV